MRKNQTFASTGIALVSENPLNSTLVSPFGEGFPLGTLGSEGGSEPIYSLKSASNRKIHSLEFSIWR